EGAAVLNRADYLAIARKNARFVLDNLRRDRLLLRTYKDGQAKLNGYLEDYSFFIAGLVTLFEVSGELLWLQEALSLAETMIEEFWDDEEGAFFYTGKSHEQLIVRSKDFFDNATPAGNSVAAEVLLRLGLLTDNSDYRRRAATILRLTAASMQRYPSGFGRLLCVLDFYLGSPKEIALIGQPDAAATQVLRKEVWRPFLPNKVVAQASPNDLEAVKLVPLLRDRPQSEGRPTAYVCEHSTCKTPTTSRLELASQLGPHTATAGSG
ncbi:MAG TPA: hypothetical protein VK208_22810, partial [Pyrinomonadaceae bacterium]|nr:hypothetical protein [Pyrinomonadaceae bacterium]